MVSQVKAITVTLYSRVCQRIFPFLCATMKIFSQEADNGR